MGNVGGEFGQAAEGVLQALQHGIEGLYGGVQFQRGLIQGEALIQLVGCHLGGHAGHFAQWFEAHPGRHPAQQQRGQCQATGEPVEPGLHLVDEMLVVAGVEDHTDPDLTGLMSIPGG